MKTRLLILTVLLLTSMTLAAQMPDALSALFGGKFRDNPAATETIIKGEPLKPYSLSRFQSLEIKGDPSVADFFEKAVKESTTDAIWHETVIKGGKLYSGVYELPAKKHRRYILYLNTFQTGGNDVTVIYLAGSATHEKIRKLIRTISK